MLIDTKWHVGIHDVKPNEWYSVLYEMNDRRFTVQGQVKQITRKKSVIVSIEPIGRDIKIPAKKIIAINEAQFKSAHLPREIK